MRVERRATGSPLLLVFVISLPLRVLPLAKRESFFVGFVLKLLRFCKEEVSRSDGGDSVIALFLNLPPGSAVLPLSFKRESFIYWTACGGRDSLSFQSPQSLCASSSYS